MITSLVVGVVIPAWDRALVLSLNDATLGVAPETPLFSVTVLNAAGMPYRRVIADGPNEFAKILECLAEQGFEAHQHGVEVLMRLPEPASALRPLDRRSA